MSDLIDELRRLRERVEALERIERQLTARGTFTPAIAGI